MSAPKWAIIARGEYLVKTSGLRRYRRTLPLMVTIFLIAYVFFIAPSLFQAASAYTADFILSNAALEFMQVILFIIFASIITIPIMQTLQDTRLSPLESLLSSPIKPKDVLIGKFIGSLPGYMVVVALIAGTFLALFIPFGMSLLQVALSVMVFLLIVLIGLWLGVLLAAILKARLSRSVRGKEAGQALAMLIALPLAVMMYGVMNGDLLRAINGQEAEITSVLWMLPSSWGAEVVLGFLRHPGDLMTDLPRTLLGLGGLITFLLSSMYLGGRLSGRAYDLEPVNFANMRAPAPNWSMKAVRLISGGGSLATVVTVIVKDFGRRMENLSRVIYVISLVVLMEIFFLSSLPPGDYVSIGLLTISWMMAFLCVFVVGEVTARGKDNLFVYRKAPYGETRLIRARIIQGCLVVLPMAALSALIVLLPAHLGVIEVLLLTGVTVGISAAYVVMSIGLFLLSPAFSERPVEMIGNALSILVISFFLYIICIVAFGEPWGLLALLGISSLLGSSLLLIGSRHIRAIE